MRVESNEVMGREGEGREWKRGREGVEKETVGPGVPPVPASSLPEF